MTTLTVRPAAPAAPAATAAGSSLDVSHLSVTFDGGRSYAVRDISFRVEPGRCVALVGESGSGKSVTARTLLGLAGQHARVAAETLRLGGLDLGRLNEQEWRGVRGRGIGLVLQDALGSLDPLRRVGQEVGEPLVIHDRLGRGALGREVAELLDRVGVPRPDVRARQYPHELSGGLRQRALIASAIAANPGILIADEPTTALDVTVQARILRLLASLRAGGAGLLLISHDLAVVSELADEVVVLRGGEVIETGPVDDVLARPAAAYTRRLIASVPSRSSRGRSLIDGAPLQERTAGTVGRRIVVDAAGLSKGFGPHHRRTAAVTDVSLAVHAGEVVGVVGESGSGKSTLGRLILGQLRPDAGEVEVLGHRWRDLRGTRLRALRRRVQTVSQDPLGTFDPRHTVARVVGEALAEVPRADRRARTVALLADVGLDDTFLARHPRTLSGGQRQRVAIARALATDPEVLVCDEAVSALDVTVQAQVLDLLERLRATTGVAMVFISHDLGVVQHIADRVLVLKDGRVVEQGGVDQVLDHPEHAHTRDLVDAIPRLRGAAQAVPTASLPLP